MAERPTFGEFVVTVLKRSMATWRGEEVWFALAAYFSVLALPLLLSGIIEDLAGEIVHRMLAVMASGWLVVLLFIVTPFRMWQEERYRLNLLAETVEEAGQPKIHVGWKFNARKRAEMVVTNISIKTIHGYELKLRNHRKADGSQITNALVSLPPVDGKQPPIDLNPLDPHYFEFAELKHDQNRDSAIAILPGTDKEVWLGKEAGVKLSSTGKDIVGSKIELRLKIENDSISIESWDANKRAVSSLVEDAGLE